MSYGAEAEAAEQLYDLPETDESADDELDDAALLQRLPLPQKPVFL